MPIRWIVFDAVGTLIHPDPPLHMAYQRIGAKYGSQLEPAEVGRRIKRAMIAEREIPAGPTDEGVERTFWSNVVRSVLDDISPESPAGQACFAELLEHFARPESWQMFADVEETLPQLRKQGFRLAIASNFDARLHRVIAGFPVLKTCLDQRFVSTEVGFRKPDARFFAAAARTCQAQPQELLMVGDDELADAKAAVDAGWHGAWLLRSTTPEVETANRYRVLRSLTELLKLR